MADGKLSEGILDEAAEFAALGLDPLRFLNSNSDFDLGMLRKLREMTEEKRRTLDHNLAVEIANILSQIMPH